jgi:MFS family permease
MAGQVHNLLGLLVTTSLLWFCGGLCLAVINILAGLHSDAAVRGRVFGLLALTSSLGAFLGGLGIGWLADHWGYPRMFMTLAAFLLLLPLSSLFVQEKTGIKNERSTSVALPKDRLPAAFGFLVLATLISAVANFFALLTRSLVMQKLEFSSLAIASPSSIGGLMTIPLAYLVGWLSDRRGRKNILVMGYLCGVLSLVVLVLARQLWLFWTVSIFQSIQTAVGATVGNALATDLVPPNRLGRAMGLLGAVVWLGGVIGLAGAGIMIQQAGSLAAILAGMACMLLATGMLLFIHPSPSSRTSPPPVVQVGE